MARKYLAKDGVRTDSNSGLKFVKILISVK